MICPLCTGSSLLFEIEGSQIWISICPECQDNLPTEIGEVAMLLDFAKKEGK